MGDLHEPKKSFLLKGETHETKQRFPKTTLEELFFKRKYTHGKFTISPSQKAIFLTKLKNTLEALWLKYVRKYERSREVMREMKMRLFTFYGCKKVIDNLSSYKPGVV